MKKTMIAAVFAATALPMSGQVLAQDAELFSGTYFRASVAQVDYGVDDDLESLGIEFGTGTGFSLVGGYQHTPFISYELGYYDLSEVSHSMTEAYGDLETMGYEGVYTAKVDLSASSFGASMRLHTDNEKSFYGGAVLGFHAWDMEAKATFVDNYDYLVYDAVSDSYVVESDSAMDSGKESDSGSDMFYGLFAAYVSPIGEFGVEYTVFEVDGDKPEMLGMSYTYRF